VRQILVQDGRAAGVVLATGEEIAAGAVVSNADPPRTLLGLVDPVHLDPDFVQKIRNYRCAGSAAKVNLALAGLPQFAALATLPDASPHDVLSGRIHIGPEIDYLERAFDAAKYGDFSTEPYLDVRIPSLLDPSLAPEGRHVMSVYMQFAPYRLREGSWPRRAEALGDAVVRTLDRHAPGLERLVLGRQVITPLDLEQTYGLTGGHIYHGEPALDQLFTMRPVLGWARYRTPIRGLYLCGAGTHPGVGVTGGSGANAGREIARDLRRRR
jgi:phytoene dehydrogenase-like protein